MNIFFQISIALLILIIPAVIVIGLTGKFGFTEGVEWAMLVFLAGWFFEKNTSVFKDL